MNFNLKMILLNLFGLAFSTIGLIDSIKKEDLIGWGTLAILFIIYFVYGLIKYFIRFNKEKNK